MIVYLATGLSPPKSVFHMFENWLHILDGNMKKDNNDRGDRIMLDHMEMSERHNI
jgi:hypothetical protein